MNIEKYKQFAVYKILCHYERGKDKNGNYYKHKNQEIDFSKTHLNYNLAEGNQWDNLINIKNKNKIRNKETVILCDWCIQIPKDYDRDPHAFLKSCYSILSEKYGINNVVSCYCHFDETTTHMHFCFCPIKDGRFNAKKILTKDELSMMHDFMEKELLKLGIAANLKLKETKELEKHRDDLEKYGIKIKGINGNYIPMRELKKNTLKKVVAQANEIKEQQEELQNLYDENDTLTDYYNKTIEVINKNEESINYQKEIIESNNKILSAQKEESDRLVESLDDKIKECKIQELKDRYNKLNNICQFMYEYIPDLIKKKVLKKLKELDGNKSNNIER